jgi:hypothetical protein
MAELRVDEFGMNFHPIYFSHPRDGVHMYYLTKFSQSNGMKFHFIQVSNTGDDFNPR